LTEATLDLRQLLEDLEHVLHRDRLIKAWARADAAQKGSRTVEVPVPRVPLRQHRLIGQGCTTRLVEIEAAAAGSMLLWSGKCVRGMVFGDQRG
jgi:hypothetical protein